VKTNQGKLFFGQSTGQQSAPSWSKDTYTQILVLTTLGLIAVCAGLSFVLAVSIVMALADNPITPGARFVAFLPVFLLTGSGVGALLAAWVMNRLSKKWGMLHDHCADQGAFQLADAHDPALAHER
jgi:hypothetical protein